MAPDYDQTEQSILRHLENRYIEFGNQPKTLSDSVTREELEKRFGLDEPTYRRFMARLQQRGIASIVAPKARGEWVKIGHAIVDVVRGLDDEPRPVGQPQAAAPIAKPILMSGTSGRSMTKKFPDGWKSGDQLGEGGQAKVFLATRETDFSGETFAIKLLKKNAQRNAYVRFVQEIEAVKKLNHPSIIKIVEHSQPDDEIQFYVMEYIDGAQSLKRLLGTDKNPFKANEARSTRMFIRILEGLEHCWEAKIVHRDLSPANILVLPDNTIKIIDFGLCQVEAGHMVSLADENIGTPNYMAPECGSHSTTTPTFCADLYSVAKVLWSAITNQGAFDREAPAFGNLSMQRLFPDRPHMWHLQIIFEHSIRQDIVNRWPDPATALVGAWNVHHMITSKTWPVESLIHRCPICYWGKMISPAQAFKGRAYQLFGEELDDECIKLVCNHCGYCFLLNKNIHHKTVERRKNLT